MNEYNHHKIISKFAKGKNIDVDTLIKASDFSDDFRGVLNNAEFSEKPGQYVIKNFVGPAVMSPAYFALKKSDPLTLEWKSETQFFYYYFYYEIRVDKKENNEGSGTIKLIRKNINADLKHKALEPEEFLKEEDLGGEDNKKDFLKNPKRYFTAVNRRESYFLEEIGEGSNQSNCVAFLHAMGAQKIDNKKNERIKFYEENPRGTFINHLKKCFAEYLYVKDDEEALFMLGIALHGIMDSFTPSHTDFQVYLDQDKGLHAQGDVLPIQDDGKPMKMEFIPGQYDKEEKAIMKYLAKYKGYDDDNSLNDNEYEMLRIFLLISNVAKVNKELDDNEIKELDDNKILDLLSEFKNKSLKLSEINNKLSQDYTYGSNAFTISNKLVETLNKVYEILNGSRNEIKDFNTYLEKKESIKRAIGEWEKGYKEIQETDIVKFCRKYRFEESNIKKLTKQKATGTNIKELPRDASKATEQWLGPLMPPL